VIVLAVGALAVAGCAGETDPATKVDTNGATLNGKAGCDQGDQGQWWFSYRIVGDPGWTGGHHYNYDCTSGARPYQAVDPDRIGDVDPNHPEDFLADAAHYQFRICGTNTTQSSDTFCADSAGDIDGTNYDDFWTRHAIVGDDCDDSNPYHGTDGTYDHSTHDGTSGDDWIKGTSGDDVIYGGGGDDLIQGAGGNDKIIGGPGHDALNGEGGNDLVIGDQGDLGGGNVTLHGNKDCLNGGVGEDTLVGDDYTDSGTASGAPDQDILLGSENDTGQDVLVGDNMANSGGPAIGGAASDWIAGSTNEDVEIGDNYSKTGNAIGGAPDELNGGPGPDHIVGDSRSNGDGSKVAQGSGNDNAAHAFIVEWIAKEFPSKPESVYTYAAGLFMGDGDDHGWGDNYGPQGAEDDTYGGDDDLDGGDNNPLPDGGDTCYGGPGTNNKTHCEKP
jgi:RTX calcium-binding nonapeptide repeat (4 copies)